ncbi:MAG TPA: DUF5696 domain-containing protein [Acholeplasmataceae bacterium]|nr:DUF5696 domain-containing protein [Acholeplasmataceae bacterium]
MKKKIIALVIISFLIVFSLGLVLKASNKVKQTSLHAQSTYTIDTDTNFFTQVDNETPVAIVDKTPLLQERGYRLIASNDKLDMYLQDRTIGIAIIDKDTGYTWFSKYEDYLEHNFTDRITAKIESGVTIQYYDTSIKVLSPAVTYFTAPKRASEKDNIVKYTNIKENGHVVGFKAEVNFVNLGITFDINVKLNGKTLVVDVPAESIKEIEVGKLSPKLYLLKSITIFPYFGSQNYKINGYSFIPDGSGALIRYTDEASSTGFLKRVYGPDYGIQSRATSNEHIKETGNITLPIFGVNHGFEQAAFLTEITKGAGSAEIESNPYMYDNLPINTTFFRFHTRDNYIVELSNGSTMSLINRDVYPGDYEFKYTFLSNKDANYIGMANTYRKSLGLTPNENSGDIPMQLEILGVDYKRGLFGKDYVKMTSFNEALEIVKDLKEANVKNINLTYLGWNDGGYFNNGANSGKVHRSLGGNKGLTNLSSYLKNNNMSIDLTINPTISDTYGFGNPSIKKINLASFDVSLISSLEKIVYYNTPDRLSRSINRNNSRYKALGVDSLNVDLLSNSYSYRYGSDAVFRTEMIDKVCTELDKITQMKISTSNPNAYLFKYLKNYYNANFESSKYLYETDSVPFISILLSGYVDLYSPKINYVSDYELMYLRMIEYNLYPSFIITKEAAYDLRFTNFEYLNSTQYELWNELIKETYNYVNVPLSKVYGAHIINHKYVARGVAEVTYSNNYKVYVNYNRADYTNGALTVPAYSYKIVGGA